MNSSSTEKQVKSKSKKPVAGKTKTGKGTPDKGNPKQSPINDAKFRGDGMRFKCKFIGMADVKNPRGDDMCVEAIKKLKLQALKLHKENKEHKQKITLNVTLKGIRILDEKSQRVEHEHPINKVSFITHDPEDKKIFGYICSVPSSTGHKLFAIKSEKFISAVITANLFELFQVVFKLRQQAELVKHTPNTVQSSPLTDPDQETAESVYEELDQDNRTEVSSSKDNDEDQYEELGPVVSHVAQSNEQMSSSPKVPTDGRDRSESSVSSTPSDSLGLSFNSEPFFSPSALKGSQEESVEAEYATITSRSTLRSGSISSGSSETNSIHHRNSDMQAKPSPLASDVGSATISHTTASEFPVSFPAPSSVGSPCESSEQEKTSTQGALSGQEDLFANFDNQVGSSDTETIYDDLLPVDDPFAPSNDQTSNMFVSSEGFAAAFDTAQFSSDPFDSAVSDKSKEVITGDEFGKEAFPTEGTKSFGAAFDTTPFSPDPFMPSDGTVQNSTGERTTDPIQESEQFDAGFGSSFSSDVFASGFPKEDDSTNLEKEAEMSSTPKAADGGVAFNTDAFATEPFASRRSIDSEPQRSAQNAEDAKAQNEPEGFQATFDTSPFPAEPFGPVPSKAVGSQAGANTVDKDTFSSTGKFKETFDMTPLSSDPFAPVASKTGEPNDTVNITDQTTQESVKFQTAFDTPPFTVDPFGSTASKDNEIKSPEETAVQTTQGSAEFQTTFDTSAFTVDPFGSTASKDDKLQAPEEATDEKTQGSAEFQTTFDTSAFTVDPFGSTASKDDKLQAPEETTDEKTQGSGKFQTTFDTPGFTVDPFGSTASKDDKLQAPEEATDEKTQGSAEFQTTFDTPGFTVDPFGSTPSKDDKIEAPEKNLEEPSGKFEVAFDTAPFDSFSSKDVPQIKTESPEETKSQLFEAFFESAKFPGALEPAESSKEKADTLESPWGNAFGQQQVQAFDAFNAKSDQSASLFDSGPSAHMVTRDDDLFFKSQPVSASISSSVETSPSNVVPSTDPFKSLKEDLPGLSTKPDAERPDIKETSPDQEKENNTAATLNSNNQADNLKRPSELSIAETKESTQRPVSPNRPPPLPPRVVAAPPLPARPRSTSNLSTPSLKDVAAHGLPVPPPLQQSYTPKKTPPPPPPRVDLEGKNGFGGNQAKAESCGHGAFTAVFNGTDTSSDSCRSSWSALWPSETKLSENGNPQSTTNKSADPFSDDFFTNFDTPQQKAKTASVVISQDPFDDPFSTKDPPASTAFDEPNFFASFPAANNQQAGSGGTAADPFSSTLPFSSSDPFEGVSDPFADKGVLGNDPFSGSPPQKSHQVDALKLSDKDPFDGDFSDSFA